MPLLQEPVSYTHLDVYKRQVLRKMGSQTINLVLSPPTEAILIPPKKLVLSPSHGAATGEL